MANGPTNQINNILNQNGIIAVNESQLASLDNIGQATINTATKGFHETEGGQNNVEEVRQKVSEASAYMSLIMSSAHEIAEVNAYNNLIYGTNSNLSTASSMGAFGSQSSTSQLEQEIGQAHVYQKIDVPTLDATGNVQFDSQGNTITHKEWQDMGTFKSQQGGYPISLSQSEIQSLASTGTFSRSSVTLPGNGTGDVLIKLPASVSATTGENLRTLAQTASNENQRIARLTSASSKSEKINAIRTMRNNSLSDLHNRTFMGASGAAQELAKFDGTRSSFDKLIKSGSLSNDAKLALQKHVQCFGFKPEGTDFIKSQQRRGRTMLIDKMSGDSVEGVRFLRKLNHTMRIAGNIGAKVGYASITRFTQAASHQLSINAKWMSQHGHHKTAKVLDFNNKIVNGTSDGVTRLRNRNLEKAQAKANGTYREYKIKKTEVKKIRKTERRTRIEERWQIKHKKKIKDAKNRGDKEALKKLNKKSQRHDLKMKRRGKKISRKENRKNVFGAINQFFGKIHKRLSNTLVGKLFTKFSAFKQALNGLIKQVIKFLAPIFAKILFFLVIFVALMSIIGMIAAFFASEPAVIKDAAHALENINYVQVIVNDTYQALEKSYLKAAQNDAQVHYARDNEIASNGLDWKCAVGDASLGHMTDEYGNEIGCISNIIPITNMMHFRFLDSINFEEFYTAEAYEYWVWVASHHTGSKDGSIPDYNFVKQTDHTLAEVSNGSCENIYYHGYDSSKSALYNQARSSAINHLLNLSGMTKLTESLQDEINNLDCRKSVGMKQFDDIWLPTYSHTEDYLEEYGPMWDDCGKQNADGSFICDGSYDGVAHTHHYLCNNYTVSASSELLRNVCTANGWSYDGECPGYTHTHSDENGCYEYTKNCTHTHDWSCGATYKNAYSCGGIEDSGSSHSCHKQGCYLVYSYYDDSGCNHKCDSYSDDSECWSKTLKCDKEEHPSHDVWESEANPGCYATEYTCNGHCGGHITPIINLWTDTDYLSLIQYDYMKATYWLDATDFYPVETDAISAVSALFSPKPTYDLETWNKYWTGKMKKWFCPIPSIFDSLAAVYRKNLEINEWCLQWSESHIWGENTEATKTDALQAAFDAKDLFDFEGWYHEDGSVNMDQIECMASLYGSKEDNYQTGIENWESFEVVFPKAGGMPLSGVQKEALLQKLIDKYSLSGTRQQVVSQAIDYVGAFIYSLERPQNKTATMGLIDCSGFVESVLYHSIGWPESRNWTASGFAQNGKPFDGNTNHLMPGDILAMNATSSYSGGSWGTDANGNKLTNHVVIYLGYFGKDDFEIPILGVEDAGYYIIDCSSSQGGSTLRRVESLNKYHYVYNSIY